MYEVGIGLLGLGVVGSAVAKAINEGNGMSTRNGVELILRGVAVKDPKKKRLGCNISTDLIHQDVNAVLGRDDIDVIVEVIGGVDPAFEYISTALKTGKHVVTANKEVLCKRGERLLEIARENNKILLFEASVGGGIPILSPLSNDLVANEISSIRAIINGTTNYILSRMSDDGSDFEEALAEAQNLGYAEADPSSDIHGHDALYKLIIIGRLAFGTNVQIDSVFREGISRIQSRDFRYSKELGYTIKLIAAAQRIDNKLLMRVHPALIPLNVPIASVSGPMNMVEVEGDLVGPLWFQGAGAGPEPTASAILGDILRVARSNDGSKFSRFESFESPMPLMDIASHECRYYIRLTAADRSGVLARVAKVLGDGDISIRSVIQMDTDEKLNQADLVIMTHLTREANMQGAASKLRDLDVVISLDNLIRVETY